MTPSEENATTATWDDVETSYRFMSPSELLADLEDIAMLRRKKGKDG